VKRLFSALAGTLNVDHLALTYIDLAPKSSSAQLVVSSLDPAKYKSIRERAETLTADRVPRARFQRSSLPTCFLNFRDELRAIDAEVFEGEGGLGVGSGRDEERRGEVAHEDGGTLRRALGDVAGVLGAVGDSSAATKCRMRTSTSCYGFDASLAKSFMNTSSP
jgi:hypothetical protein